MIYVWGGLLDEGKEMHRESEAVSCLTVQAVGKHVNLVFIVNKQGFHGSRN